MSGLKVEKLIKKKPTWKLKHANSILESFAKYHQNRSIYFWAIPFKSWGIFETQCSCALSTVSINKHTMLCTVDCIWHCVWSSGQVPYGWTLANLLVFRTVRSALGFDRCRMCVCVVVRCRMAGHWLTCLYSGRSDQLSALTGVVCVCRPLLLSWRTRWTSSWVWTCLSWRSTEWVKHRVCCLNDCHVLTTLTC